MRKAALVFVMAVVLTLAACAAQTLPAADGGPFTDDGRDDFISEPSVEVSQETIENCIAYAAALGYETGEFRRAIRLGEERMSAVTNKTEAADTALDADDLLLLFDNVRCAADAQTGEVLGTIPFV